MIPPVSFQTTTRKDYCKVATVLARALRSYFAQANAKDIIFEIVAPANIGKSLTASVMRANLDTGLGENGYEYPVLDRLCLEDYPMQASSKVLGAPMNLDGNPDTPNVLFMFTAMPYSKANVGYAYRQAQNEEDIADFDARVEKWRQEYESQSRMMKLVHKKSCDRSLTIFSHKETETESPSGMSIVARLTKVADPKGCFHLDWELLVCDPDLAENKQVQEDVANLAAYGQRRAARLSGQSLA